MGNDVPLAGLIGLLPVLLLLSAFFSGSETALMSLNRYQLRHKSREGHRGARLAENLLKRPDRVIGLILLGNNLVNFSMASLVGIITYKVGGESAAAFGTIALTLVVLVFSETAPKTLAALHPERVAFPAAMIYYPLLKITYPLVWLTNLCANGVLFLFGVRASHTELQALTREELRTVVHEAGSRISSRYRTMLISILDLEKVTVDDVMVPHNEIIGIDLDNEDDEVEKIVSNSEHTRLPVYRDNIDKVIGILHLRKLANLARQDMTKATLQRLLTEPYFVPEGTPLSTQLIQFQRRRERIAMVVDEYGDIQGLVTLDDILEEIVGEFTPEGRGRSRTMRRLDDGSYLVDGSTNLRTLNRRLDWDLPFDEAHTLGGLLIEKLEVIPEGKCCINIGPHTMIIVDIRDNVIHKVLIKPDRIRRT